MPGVGIPPEAAEKTVTVTEPIEPISVAVIGNDDRTPPIVNGVTAVTPDSQPNIIINVVKPIVAVLVRFINQFLTTLVGLVAAGMTPAGGRILRADDFFGLVITCASLSIAGAGLGLIKDLVTIFGRLEAKYPLLTGSI